MSDESRFQPDQLLRRLVDQDVRFVIIGGFAAQAHGSPSLTADLDIVPSWDRANLEKIADILQDIAAIRHGRSPCQIAWRFLGAPVQGPAAMEAYVLGPGRGSTECPLDRRKSRQLGGRQPPPKTKAGLIAPWSST